MAPQRLPFNPAGRLAIVQGCLVGPGGSEPRGAEFHAALGRDMSPLARAQMLAPFQLRSYRLQWPADLLTSCAFEMETLILGWYVLVVTNSVLLLTLFGALQFTGTLVAPGFGVAGDRIGHRRLIP